MHFLWEKHDLSWVWSTQFSPCCLILNPTTIPSMRKSSNVNHLIPLNDSFVDSQRAVVNHPNSDTAIETATTTCPLVFWKWSLILYSSCQKKRVLIRARVVASHLTQLYNPHIWERLFERMSKRQPGFGTRIMCVCTYSIRKEKLSAYSLRQHLNNN